MPSVACNAPEKEETSESGTKTSRLQISTILVLGILQVAAPLSLVADLTDLTSLEPCNDRCVYFKQLPDSTPLKPTQPNCSFRESFNWESFKASFVGQESSLLLLAITNGENWTSSKVRSGCSIPDHLVPKAICPNQTTESMQRHCEGSAVKAKVINIMSKLPSARLFQWSCCAWGLLRIVHDVLLLHACSEDVTLLISISSAISLAVMAGSSLMWSMSMLEVFYALVGDDCGCFYRKSGISAILLLLAPAALLWATQRKACEVLRAVIGGDYLIIVKYHVAMRHIRGTLANPTDTLLGIEGFASPLGMPVSLCTAKASVPRKEVRCMAVLLPTLFSFALLFPGMYTCSALSIRLVDVGAQIADMAPDFLCLQFFRGRVSLDRTGTMGAVGLVVGEILILGLFTFPLKLVRVVMRMEPPLQPPALGLSRKRLLQLLVPNWEAEEPPAEEPPAELAWALAEPSSEAASPAPGPSSQKDESTGLLT